jgi:integrator complex subunit 6
LELRKRGMSVLEESQRQQQNQKVGLDSSKPLPPVVRYGQYDPRTPVDSYLAALRHMPAPWKSGIAPKPNREENTKVGKKQFNVMETLGDLPAKCLMAYYESRRRWIFGGSGLSTRGLFVEGVQNDGSNSQRCGAKRDRNRESLLSLAGIGVSQMNETTTAKMGDYRERLLWSTAPIVGTGANDATGVSSTTAQNGAPAWSVEDEAMPIAFFDPKTGEFSDSLEARIRSRLMVNFGNRKY